jgi:hypothetical protein
LISGKEEREVANNLNLLRSHLESKQKELIEVLEQLKISVNHYQDKQTGNTSNEKWETVGESFELEICLALERQISKKLDGVMHALHMLEEGK